MFQNWYNFNEDKSINAISLRFSREDSKGWNDLYKKKGDNEHQIKLISINSK
jgi:hypothetical protein